MRKKITPPRPWQSAAIAVLTVAAVLSLTGCNVGQSSKPSASGTGGQSTGNVGLSASSLNFGSVNVGASKTMDITLTNSTAAGGANVTVSQVKATGTGFSTTNTLPVDLAPGQSIDLSVVFTPTIAGSSSGSLTINLVGANNPANLPLNGSGANGSAPAQLAVLPSTLGFGSVTIGNSKNLTASLNATNSDVTVSSAAWNGSGYAVTGITFPTTVKAGKSVSFTVTFAPQSSGSASGNISFVSNAANSPTGENLTGSGAQSAQQHTVSLTWVPSTSQVAGYNVYRGTQSGGPYARLNGSLSTNPTYSDSSVQSGLVYYYVATAVDSSAAESGYSGEVTAVIPTP